jgi:sodium-dependent dicarboxylate transporter 2/3/5
MHPTNSPQSAAKKGFWSSSLGLTLIAVAIGLVLWAIIPATNGLTDVGVRFLAIVIAAMFLWIKVGTDWPALLFLGMLVVGGVLTPGALWNTSIGNPIVALVLVYTMLAVCLSRNGVIDSITAWFISRPFVKGRPYAFIAMFFAAHFAVGTVMHNFAVFVVFLSITVRLCKALDIDKSHKLYIILMCGNLWVNGIINGATPIAKTIPNIIIGLLYSQLGVTVTYMQWLAVGIPIMIVSLGVVMLTVRILNPDVSVLRNLDVDEFVASTPKMTKRGKIAVVATLIVVAITILPEIFLTLGLFVGVSSWLMGLGVSVPAVIAIAVLSLTRVEGENVLQFDAVIKDVPLSMLIFVGAIMVMGAPMASPHTGVVLALSNILDPIFGGMSPLLIIFFAGLGSLVITQFISNSVTAILFLNLGIAIFVGMGDVSIPMIVAFALVVGLTSCYAISTPGATIVTPLIFSAGHINVANSIKTNLVFLVMILAATMFIFIPFITWFIAVLGL